MAPELFVDDPILPMKDSAIYLGFRGKNPQRSLYRLIQAGQLERAPMPTTGPEPRFGIRRSVLNRYLASLANPRARNLKATA
jgi:hypothetical protein